MNLNEHNGERDFYNAVSKLKSHEDLDKFRTLTVNEILNVYMKNNFITRLTLPSVSTKFYWTLSNFLRDHRNHIKVLDMSYEHFKEQFEDIVNHFLSLDKQVFRPKLKDYANTVHPDWFLENEEPAGNVLISANTWSVFLDSPDSFIDSFNPSSKHSDVLRGVIGTFKNGKTLYYDGFRPPSCRIYGTSKVISVAKNPLDFDFKFGFSSIDPQIFWESVSVVVNNIKHLDNYIMED